MKAREFKQIRANRPATSQRFLLQAAQDTRLEHSWTRSPVDAETYIKKNYSVLVARGREQTEQSDHARSYQRLIKVNVVPAKGFTFSANIRKPGNQNEFDLEARRAVKEAWKRFSRRGKFEHSGMFSRAQVEKLQTMQLCNTGEFILQKRFSRRANEFGFNVKILDPILLPVQLEKNLANGGRIIHGIEFDKFGRLAAYHFSESRTGSYYDLNHKTKRIPAEQIIHVFIPEIVGQKRGLPGNRTALWRLRMLQGFEDASLVNARIGAASMGFFENKEPDDTHQVDEFPLDIEPGTFQPLPAGWEFKDYSPKYPNGDFEPFTRGSLRSIAAGLGVSYASMTHDLTDVNYSSIRQGTLAERDTFTEIQETIIEGLCEPVFEDWLYSALLNQQIFKPNGQPYDFTEFERFNKPAFKGKRWTWIDPTKEIKASIEAIKGKLKSRSEVIRENSDREPEEVFAEIGEEISLLGEILPDTTTEPDQTQEDNTNE
jgi:lambda family phage portal protein